MGRLRARLGWALAGALALALVAVLARGLEAGPLDPPPGPVGSTMRTLGDLVPAWHEDLDSSGCGSERWECVLNDEAVLDHETGLVWQKTASWTGTDTWHSAALACSSAGNGGRYGWRLPTVQELLTLKDSNTLDIVSGHPFTNAPNNTFWSSTPADDDETRARYITFSMGASNEQSAPKTAPAAGFWCVRGGSAQNVQSMGELPAWARVLDATGGCNSPRFTCIWNSSAVLDRTTGLVWTRNADALGIGSSLEPGVSNCATLALAPLGVTGWRVPRSDELSSLLDRSVLRPELSLPSGHPFQNVAGASYWTSTSGGLNDTFVGVSFLGALVGSPGWAYMLAAGTDGALNWCVRGP